MTIHTGKYDKSTSKRSEKCFLEFFTHRAVNENIDRAGWKTIRFSYISLLDLGPVDGEEEMVDADSTRVPRWCHITLRS